MVQNEDLIVAEIAYGIVTVMRIVKGDISQLRQLLQMEHLFEIIDLVSRQIKHLQVDLVIQRFMNELYPIS